MPKDFIDFNQKTGFICDMDGVIYHGNRILPGVADFIQWLHEESKEYLFLTNNSGYTPRELQQKLARMGLDVPEEHFYTSALATAAFLKDQSPGCSVFAIGEAGLLNALYDAGLTMNDVNPDYVVVGEGRTYSLDTLTKAVNLVINGVGSVLGATVSVVSTTVGQVITLFLGLVFSAYLLLSKEKLSSQFQRLMRGYLGEKTTRKILHFVRTLDTSFHSYIVGQCTEALILGSLCILGMLLFRFPYAVMIGTLVGFTALIPIAGAYIGAVVGAFMIFTVSPVKALLFLVFLVVLQQLEGNLIFPRVVGQSIGLPGLWVLAAVTVGGGVAGIPGMLIGVPLTATFYRLIRADINSRTDMLLPLRSIPAMRDDDPPPADTPPKA